MCANTSTQNYGAPGRSLIDQASQPNVFVHVGAPRTGTSFLRKYVFPNVYNVHFENKQSTSTELTRFFSSLAHHGDGDELSESLTRRMPKLSAKKVLVSEEHLIWSVYHMMGNIGSRALLLKQVIPEAKIILTIRRQPEYFISLFQYFQTLERGHLGRQMRSIENMLNLTKNIEQARLQWFGPIPCGIELEERLATFSIDQRYFRRDWRHFVAADFSWFRLFNIYAGLFGKGNVVVLPQEIWSKAPGRGIEILEGFVQESIDWKNVPFSEKVNSSDNRVTPFATKEQHAVFSRSIMSLTWSSNKTLDEQLSYLDLSSLGYCEVPKARTNIRIVGFRGSGGTNIRGVPFRILNLIRKNCQRLGTSGCVKQANTVFWRGIANPRRWRRVVYRLSVLLYERFQGIDFERMESVGRLGLNESVSEQYQASKLVELKKVFADIQIPPRCKAIDFGAGKGRVVWYLSTLPQIEKATGIEVSEALVNIAKKNFRRLRATNAAMLHCDARAVPAEVLDEATLFYFYNPFPRKVFEDVFRRIEESVCFRNPRSSVLIYFNPVYEDLILRSPAFRRKSDYINAISNAKIAVFIGNRKNDERVAAS